MTEERLTDVKAWADRSSGWERRTLLDLCAEVRTLRKEIERLQGQAWATMCATLRAQRDEARARVTELEIYQAGLLNECQQLREKARVEG